MNWLNDFFLDFVICSHKLLTHSQNSVAHLNLHHLKGEGVNFTIPWEVNHNHVQ